MSGDERKRRAEAASFFLARASEALEAADHARSDAAAEAHHKQAETWLYMANRCLGPEAKERPPRALSSRPVRPPERRTFSSED